MILKSFAVNDFSQKESLNEGKPCIAADEKRKKIKTTRSERIRASRFQ
ncbi:hypothetical protein EVA_06807 [gut metagenome]|uniref:Uncharacterized protein n=1 Tax=gut metagenome TaxID=749906 RepID=J9GWR9_9ZZZZ